MTITFKPLHESHFPLLLKWLETPHVKKWWDQDVKYTMELVRKKFGKHTHGIALSKNSNHKTYAYIICANKEMIGYIQAYNAHDFAQENGLNLSPISGSVCGVDLFIGEQQFLHQGWGARVLNEFEEQILAPHFDWCLIDPPKDNLTAIKAFTKAGFKIFEQFQTESNIWMSKELLPVSFAYDTDLNFDEKNNIKSIVIRAFEERDAVLIENILKVIGWADQYVVGQLECIKKLCCSKTGEVFVATHEEVVVGFIQVEHHQWNRLSYLHGLVVHPDFRRLGIAKNLVEHVELSSKNRQQRGISVDTPVDNLVGRKFYTSIGFTEAYIMPEFYESGLDGVTFQKFFEKKSSVHLNARLEELKLREPILHHPEKFGNTAQDISKQMCDEFWEVGASGNVYTKQDVIETLLERYNDPNYQDIWEAKNFELTKIAPDNYLLTYILIQDKTRVTRRSTIWRRVNGDWKILYHQGTVIDGGGA